MTDRAERNEEGETILCYHDHREETGIVEGLPEAPGETRLEKLRAIVAEKSMMGVEGQPVDLFSANLTVQVHDLLRPENQAKLMTTKNVAWTIGVCFKLVEKAKSKP
jgi:hypothetical protein